MSRAARYLLASMIVLACVPSCVLPAGAAPPAPARVKDARPQATAPPEAPPTMEETQKLFDDGDYRAALQKANRALSLKGQAAAGYDRHALLRLKAEGHLKLKDVKAAADAFAKAAKEAPDEAAAAEDLVTETVIRRSKNLEFTPKATEKNENPAAVDISDREKRKAAFEALLAEQKADLIPKARTARQSKALPPIIEAMKLVGAFRTTELAATGEDAQAKEMTDELAGRAHKLMAEAMEDMAAATDGIEAAANEYHETAVPVRNPGGRGASLTVSYKKAGLSTQDRKELNGIIADLKKLVPTCREMAAALGDAGGGKDFEKLAEYGADVGNKAFKVLNTDYDRDELDRMRTAGNRLRRPVERR